MNKKLKKTKTQKSLWDRKQMKKYCKLSVQSKLRPQRLTQPGYSSVHQLCVNNTNKKF